MRCCSGESGGRTLGHLLVPGGAGVNLAILAARYYISPARPALAMRRLRPAVGPCCRLDRAINPHAARQPHHPGVQRSCAHPDDDVRGDRLLRFARNPCEIIVSADGNDGTREAARDLAPAALAMRRFRSSARPGAAARAWGFAKASACRSGDIIGFADADNKTPITEFDKVRPLLDAGHDVVIGSRGLGESRIERPQPWFRRVGSKGVPLRAQRQRRAHRHRRHAMRIQVLPGARRPRSLRTPADRRLHVRRRDPLPRPATPLQHRAGAGPVARRCGQPPRPRRRQRAQRA